jgi:hypothetical protein
MNMADIDLIVYVGLPLLLFVAVIFDDILRGEIGWWSPVSGGDPSQWNKIRTRTK